MSDDHSGGAAPKPDGAVAAPYGLTKDGRPRKKTGPPKGTRVGGKKRGSKNKRTLAREAAAARELELLRQAEEARRAALAEEVAKATGKAPVSGKEALIQLVSAYMGLTAFYQPVQPMVRGADGKITCANPNYDEERFRYYSAMAKETAIGLAPFQHPRYSAVVVGASVVTKVEVTGGMPDDFAPPIPDGQVVELVAGAIINAEDEAPPALLPPKAVAG
jgi:hypothetical protein